MLDKAPVRDFVDSLVRIVQKANGLSRLIRSNPTLFSLLVEEKTGDSANRRFDQDFKTLADVLIQEMARFDLVKNFPALKGRVFGEESNKFSVQTGDGVSETVEILVNGQPEVLLEALRKVIPDHEAAPGLLTDAVYSRMPEGSSGDACDLPPVSEMATVDLRDVGIWIDPIDGTNVYINPKPDDVIAGTKIEIAKSSLSCVTVLIGAFRISDGRPLVGVVGRPFVDVEKEHARWHHSIYWAYSIPGEGERVVNKTSGSLALDSQLLTRIPGRRAVMSDSDKDYKQMLQESGRFGEIVAASGAGYKLACSALGLANIYICTKPSTYQYDTCGPHCLLIAQGGGIVDFRKLLENVDQLTNAAKPGSGGDAGDVHLSQSDGSSCKISDILAEIQLKYCLKTEGMEPEDYANRGGLVAYRNVEDLIFLVGVLKSLKA